MDHKLPKLSIIVPNYNAGSYIEETLLSIINQNYSNKELIIIDGGSTDESVDIIKKHEEHITYWVSEKDDGQADAINKGFEKATGDYIAWMNSDDTYYKNAFIKIFSNAAALNADFIYGPAYAGKNAGSGNLKLGSYQQKLSAFNLLHFFYSTEYIIPSQSVFIRKAFLKDKKVSFLNKDCHYCMDMEWYCRIALANPNCYKYTEALSFFRINSTTKTGSQYSKMHAEAIQIFLNYRKFLTRQQISKIYRLLFLHRTLNKLFKNNIKINTSSLLKLISKVPREALADKRVLGLFKKTIV